MGWLSRHLDRCDKSGRTIYRQKSGALLSTVYETFNLVPEENLPNDISTAEVGEFA